MSTGEDAPARASTTDELHFEPDSDVRLLALTHGPNSEDLGVFRESVADEGLYLEERSMLDPSPLPDSERFAGVIVLGGSMHAYEEEEHPWLRREDVFLRDLIRRKIPTLGVCFGAQLLAKAAGGSVRRADQPEIGWVAVELDRSVSGDLLIGSLPTRFFAFNWHVDTWSLPQDDGAHELARSGHCSQAFRVGEVAWGVQFHAEVDRSIVRSWLDKTERDTRVRDALWLESDARMDEWNEIGKGLCSRFAQIAARRASRSSP